MLDETGCERTKNERNGRANQWMGRLGSISRCRANKYEVMRCLKEDGGSKHNVWVRNDAMEEERIRETGSNSEYSRKNNFGCK